MSLWKLVLLDERASHLLGIASYMLYMVLALRMVYPFKQHALVGWEVLTPNSTGLYKLPFIAISSCGDGIK